MAHVVCLPKMSTCRCEDVGARRCPTLRENCDAASPSSIFIRRRVARVSNGGELVRLLAGSGCLFWGSSGELGLPGAGRSVAAGGVAEWP